MHAINILYLIQNTFLLSIRAWPFNFYYNHINMIINLSDLILFLIPTFFLSQLIELILTLLYNNKIYCEKKKKS